MSRSGYIDDIDILVLGRWRGAVARSIRGKRGQAFLRELIAALDAMPERRLIAHNLQDDEGGVCALGCVGAKRGMDMAGLDPKNSYQLSDVFDIASPLVCEIEFINDEDSWYSESPESRWFRVRSWAAGQLV